MAQRNGNLLDIGHRAAEILLITGDDANMESSLLESMALVGRAADADRVQIWRNEAIDGVLHFVLAYEWLSDEGRKKTLVPKGLHFSYSQKTEWKSMFLRGEYINAPFSKLPPDDQDFLNAYDIRTLVIIPLFLHKEFWGFFSLDDCRRERVFSEDEIESLRSVSLMMSSAVNRHEQALRLQEAYGRVKMLLDATPLVATLWDRNCRIFDCNGAALTLFGVADTCEFVRRFDELSP